MHRKRLVFTLGCVILCLVMLATSLLMNGLAHSHAAGPLYTTMQSHISTRASSTRSFDVVNGTYYGSNGSSIYALNATTGALIWKYQPSGYTQVALPGIHNGVVYASLISWSGGPTAQVAALAATGGTLLWVSSQVIPGLIDSLQFVNGIILIHASQVAPGDGLFALKASDGSLLWNYMVSDYVSVPVISQGVIFANSMWLEGTPDMKTCALNASDGFQRWCYPNAYLNTISQGVVYADAFSPSSEIALNASSGSLIWSNSGIVKIIAVQKFVYASGNAPDTLCELNASDGSQLWCSSTLGPVRIGASIIYTYSTGSSSNQNSTEALKASDGSALWLRQNTNFISAYQGIVYALDASNNLEAIKGSAGTLLWQHNLGTTGIASNSPATNGVFYYLGNDAHSLFALNATNGALLWQHTFVGSPQLPTVVNGIAYVLASTTVNGQQVMSAFAFDTGKGALLWSY